MHFIVNLRKMARVQGVSEELLVCNMSAGMSAMSKAL